MQFSSKTSCASSSSSSSILEMKGLALEHADPWHWPQAGEHFIPCFWHEHLPLLQSVLQLHLIIFIKLSGAGGKSVIVGINPDSC